jgi:succinate dehydrogenase/fumarate reductase cytochrome b subunit
MSLSDAKRAAEGVADSKPLGWLARAGLTARAAVYILIGVLALLLALGSTGKEVDQKGALSEVLSHSYGTAVVGALAVGFFGYALWRISEAAFGVTVDGSGTGPRLKSLARGIAYLVLTLTAVSALRGVGQSQAGQQETLTAQVMGHAGGRWLVAAVGVAVVAVGVAMVVEGWTLKFMRYFRALPSELRTTVMHLGRAGTIARGLVFALVGVLIVSAAWTTDPQRAGGIDSAFRTLLGQPYGQLMAIVAALALVAFGIYGFAEARYRRV